ncbi:MAG TPA: magnesium/cobalt transporter CorA [Roseiflexaceae bacterium]|nr:magnesium/cobalt transporter CorA [Roseiflexaceae bacterium]
MPETLVCYADGRFNGDIAPAHISETLHDPNTVVWLDIRDPNEQDIALLREEFNFHELSLEDAVREQQRPKVEAFEGYYFIVFYAVVYQEDRILTQALHLFVGPNYLVSVHRGDFRQIDETVARWRSPNSPLGKTVGALLYALLDAIVDDYFPTMDRLTDRIEELEDAIFEQFDKTSIQTIFGLKRDLLMLRRTLGPERDVVNVLLRREVPVFRPKDLVYLQDLYDHIVRLSDNIDTYRDLLSSALDSYLSLQSNRLNQIVKVLTIASIILMSNALIAGIYGMNFEYMPELDWQFGYPFAIGLMLFISVGLVALFKRLKWI